MTHFNQWNYAFESFFDFRKYLPLELRTFQVLGIWQISCRTTIRYGPWTYVHVNDGLQSHFVILSNTDNILGRYSFRRDDSVHLSSPEDNTTLDSLLQCALDLNWAFSTQARAIAISAISSVRKYLRRQAGGKSLQAGGKSLFAVA